MLGQKNDNSFIEVTRNGTSTEMVSQLGIPGGKLMVNDRVFSANRIPLECVENVPPV